MLNNGNPKQMSACVQNENKSKHTRGCLQRHKRLCKLYVTFYYFGPDKIKSRSLPPHTASVVKLSRQWADPPGQSTPKPTETDNAAWGGDGSAEAVGMPGGAAEDVPVCLVLGTASVTAIETKKKSTNCTHQIQMSHQWNRSKPLPGPLSTCAPYAPI